jgi:hypothetical protein
MSIICHIEEYGWLWIAKLKWVFEFVINCPSPKRGADWGICAKYTKKYFLRILSRIKSFANFNNLLIITKVHLLI